MMNTFSADKSLPYFQVNAFTENAFGGNPAGVCPLSEWLDDDLMQKIAAENNLSETAFFISTENNSYDLRWFTPSVEVDFCGHATLASGFIVLNVLRTDLNAVHFKTKIGDLSVRRENDEFLVMNVPSLRPKPVKISSYHQALFNHVPSKILEAGMNLLLIFDGGEEEILMLEPNFEAMTKFPDYGFIVSSKGTSTDFVSRYFAPNHGVPEDPVTGSAHATLAPYWANKLGLEKLSARQVSKRGGDLILEMKEKRIDIWGKCCLAKQGTFYLTKKF